MPGGTCKTRDPSNRRMLRISVLPEALLRIYFSLIKLRAAHQTAPPTLLPTCSPNPSPPSPRTRGSRPAPPPPHHPPLPGPAPPLGPRPCPRARPLSSALSAARCRGVGAAVASRWRGAGLGAAAASRSRREESGWERRRSRGALAAEGRRIPAPREGSAERAAFQPQ